MKKVNKDDHDDLVDNVDKVEEVNKCDQIEKVHQVHQVQVDKVDKVNFINRVAWPSGLRRWFKAPVSSEAWVRIPPLPDIFSLFVFNCLGLPLQI